LATQYTSTDSASLGGTAGSAGLVQKAYDKFIEFALRDEPLIRSVADKRPVSPTNNGNVVVLQKYADLANATTALTESTDIDGVAVGTPTSVTIRSDAHTSELQSHHDHVSCRLLTKKIHQY